MIHSPCNPKTAFTFILLVAFAARAYSQYVNVKISGTANPNETSIAINPKNTAQLLAGANLNSVYLSNDGGLTWERKAMTSTYGVWGDPVMAFDTAGAMYFLHLSNPPAGSWIDRIVCQRSTDQGITWNNGTGIGLNGSKNQDKEWVCVNQATNELYVTWTEFDAYGSSNASNRSNILFSKSADQGATWSQPLRINQVDGDCIDSDNTVEGAVPAMGPAGQLYVAWAGPAGLVFDRSTDGGATWLENDITVSDIPGGWDYMVPGIYRCNGLPVTCCDISRGRYRGNIYINWTDQRNGEGDTDVWLAKSTDGGNTWSSAKRVNDDPAGKQQFFTWMTVDQVTGYLWFVFYDRREYSDTKTDVWMAVSKDGGETFTNFRVSESPFIPNPNVFFGDYTGIAAHNSIVRPVWTRLDNTVLSAWTALVDTLHTVSAYEPPHGKELYTGSFPNPFSQSTAFSFKLMRKTAVTLSVYDVFGHKVASVYENEMLQPGKYIENFRPGDSHLPSGVYYFSLKGEGISRQSKMIYQK